MKFHLQKTVVLEVPKEKDLRLDTFTKEDIQRLSTALKKAGIYHRIEVSDKKSSVLIYD